MRWRRRRGERPSGTAIVPAPRVERALVALVVHAQQLDDRLDRLERRLDATVDATMDAPTHDDVLEVRLHSAKVAAELARVSVELRAEIEHRVSELRTHQQQTHTQPQVPPLTEHEQRVQTMAEAIIDLSDRLDRMPPDYRDVASA